MLLNPGMVLWGRGKYYKINKLLYALSGFAVVFNTWAIFSYRKRSLLKSFYVVLNFFIFG